MRISKIPTGQEQNTIKNEEENKINKTSETVLIQKNTNTSNITTDTILKKKIVEKINNTSQVILNEKQIELQQKGKKAAYGENTHLGPEKITFKTLKDLIDNASPEEISDIIIGVAKNPNIKGLNLAFAELFRDRLNEKLYSQDKLQNAFNALSEEKLMDIVENIENYIESALSDENYTDYLSLYQFIEKQNFSYLIKIKDNIEKLPTNFIEKAQKLIEKQYELSKMNEKKKLEALEEQALKLADGKYMHSGSGSYSYQDIINLLLNASATEAAVIIRGAAKHWCNSALSRCLAFLLTNRENNIGQTPKAKLQSAFEALSKDALEKLIVEQIKRVNYCLDSPNGSSHVVTSINKMNFDLMLKFKDELSLNEDTIELIEELLQKTKDLDQKKQELEQDFRYK